MADEKDAAMNAEEVEGGAENGADQQFNYFPVAHDPHHDDVSVAQAAASAIAASASAYNIPQNNTNTVYLVDAHAVFAGNNNNNMNSAMAMAASASTAAMPAHLSAPAYTNATNNIPVSALDQTQQQQLQTQQQQGVTAVACARRECPMEQGTQPNYDQQTAITDTNDKHVDEQCSAGRHAMNFVLEEQKTALSNLAHAQEVFDEAKRRLDVAKQQAHEVDERVRATAESLADELLEEKTRWNEMYRRLVQYHREHGTCQVARRQSKRNKSITNGRAGAQSLATWVGSVRIDARRPLGHQDRLEPYKVVALDRLGFDWQPRENYWMDMYEQLKTYLQNNGGRMPPRFIKNEKFALGQWCDTQLDNYRKYNSGKKGAYITQEKIDMLNQIGFVWDKRGQMWRKNYDRLKEFYIKHGHCNATTMYNGGDKTFGAWVAKQKKKYINWEKGNTKSLENSLSDEQASLLREIRFDSCVSTDGRKIRSLKKLRKEKNKVGASIDELVKASENIDRKSSSTERFDGGEHEETANHAEDAGELVADEGDLTVNAESSVVANWGDSANAVSLLVDAIMNKESHALPAGQMDEVGDNEWSTND